MRSCSCNRSCVRGFPTGLSRQILDRCTCNGAGNSLVATARLRAFCSARMRSLSTRFQAMRPDVAVAVAFFDLYLATAAVHKALPHIGYLGRSFADLRVRSRPRGFG